MSAKDTLLKPKECAMLLVDFQAGLGFGVESLPVQVVFNNAVALARTGAAFIIQQSPICQRHPAARSLRTYNPGRAPAASPRLTVLPIRPARRYAVAIRPWRIASPERNAAFSIWP